jgi:Na+-driven multidrug efflux pump
MDRRVRTSEELILLISYLSLIGIWFAIPSVSLLINRDKRWPIALSLLGIIVLFLLISYILHWEVLFPRSATEFESDKMA